MKHVTVKQALKHVAENPRQISDEQIQAPVWELICRNLYQISNSPDANVRGSMSKANAARKLIMDRLGGKRRAGTHPATKDAIPVEFVDLTGKQVEE